MADSRRSFLAAVLAVIVVLISYVAVNLAQVWWVGAHDAAQHADVIVVLGAAQYDGRPSAQLKARLDHALELWRNGTASKIIVTGGNRPGDRFTEAGTSSAYLNGNDVSKDAILLEDAGTNTYDSLRTVSEMMVSSGFKTAVVVTDPFHELRCVLTLRQLGITAYASATETSPVDGWTALVKHLKETLGVSIGRIVGFRRLLSLTG